MNLLTKSKKLLDKLKRNKRFSRYPCEDYLHNALKYLQDGANCDAYTEICWALIKSGAELKEDEREIFEKYQERFQNLRLEDVTRCPYCNYIPKCNEQTCKDCKVYEDFLDDADDLY